VGLDQDCYNQVGLHRLGISLFLLCIYLTGYAGGETISPEEYERRKNDRREDQDVDSD
jgi:hypothetical protein